jgi:hypothetical protein
MDLNTENASRIWAGWSVMQRRFYKMHTWQSQGQFVKLATHLPQIDETAEAVADILVQWSKDYAKGGRR